MHLESAGSDETRAIGNRLGRLLSPGGVVCLYGDIGAGKTTLIKGLAAAFGIEERDITSASFTIIAEYDTEPPFYHVDLYRLHGGSDVEDIGLHEYIGGNGVTVIEWAERLGEPPHGAVTVRIDITGENERVLEIEGIDEEDWNHM